MLGHMRLCCFWILGTTTTFSSLGEHPVAVQWCLLAVRLQPLLVYVAPPVYQRHNPVQRLHLSYNLSFSSTFVWIFYGVRSVVIYTDWIPYLSRMVNFICQLTISEDTEYNRRYNRRKNWIVSQNSMYRICRYIVLTYQYCIPVLCQRGTEIIVVGEHTAIGRRKLCG